MPMSMTYNKLLTDKLLSLDHKDLKDLLTVDLVSFYFLSRVDIAIRYIGVYFAFGLPDYVRYIEVRYIEVLFHTFYCNLGRDIEYRSLYRGLR